MSRNLFKEHIEFCNKIYKKSTETSCLHHAMEEILEVLKETDDEHKPEEYADILMCLLHGMNKAGISYSQVMVAFSKKLDINKLRDWKENADGSYSHVK